MPNESRLARRPPALERPMRGSAVSTGALSPRVSSRNQWPPKRGNAAPAVYLTLPGPITTPSLPFLTKATFAGRQGRVYFVLLPLLKSSHEFLTNLFASDRLNP